MDASLPPPDRESPARADRQEVVAERKRLIAELRRLIFAEGDTGTAATVESGTAPAFSPDHDPVLRRRTEAVEVLGRYPDREAAQVLSELILRGEREIAPPAGRWLRDTALLALLRSHRLPRAEVNKTLLRAYSFLRHPFPWQWSRVYDELPLLAQYGKTWVFFVAFLVWALLLVAYPTSILVRQLLDPGYYKPDELRSFVVVAGTGLAIYLLHQMIIAWLAGLGRPLLRVPGGGSHRWKAIGAALLALVGISLVVASRVIIGSECDDVMEGPCSKALWWIAIVQAPLLVPMFSLAHDLEQIVRYAPRGTARLLRVLAFVLRRTIELTYIFTLPTVAGAVWSSPTEEFREVVLPYLAYLFAVPVVLVLALRLGAALVRALGNAIERVQMRRRPLRQYE